MKHTHVTIASGAFLICLACGAVLRMDLDRRPHGPGEPRMTQEATLPTEPVEGPYDPPTNDPVGPTDQGISGNRTASATGFGTRGADNGFRVISKIWPDRS